MFELTEADACIVESKEKSAQIAEGDKKRRVLKSTIKVDIDLDETVIEASKPLLPFLKEITQLVAGEETCKGLDVKAKTKPPVSAVRIEPRAVQNRSKSLAFDWNAVEIKDAVFKINAKGEGTLSLKLVVSVTKADMGRLVEMFEAEASITIQPSDPAGSGLDDDPAQTTLADAIDKKNGANDKDAPNTHGPHGEVETEAKTNKRAKKKASKKKAGDTIQTTAGTATVGGKQPNGLDEDPPPAAA